MTFIFPSNFLSLCFFCFIFAGINPYSLPMKHLYLVFVLLAATLTAQAGGYDYLTFEKSDGRQVSVKADGLKMTFTDGNLVARNNEGTMTFALAELSKMFFAETSGVKDVKADDAREVAVYNLSGVKLGSFRDAASAQNALVKGVYVVRKGARTYKVTVK